MPEIPVQALVDAARAASANAYAPYSKFRVGAAVLTDQGVIHAGCNVENASYGMTICAERNSIFQAVAKGARRVSAIAIYTPTSEPTPPCGACRQVIREFGPHADVYSVCDGPAKMHHKLDQLLPESFGPESL